MRSSSPSDLPQSSFFDIAQQLDQSEPLLALARAIPWTVLEETFSKRYSDKGRRAKPIRLMCALLMLKQLYYLSDETVVLQWKLNSY